MESLTEKSAKQWSRLGPRAIYGLAMLHLVQENERVYALSADLGTSSGLQRLVNQHPDRYINTGIAEQNLIGVSAGFAKMGLIPFASSFAPFVTARCLDQIRMNLGYMDLNVKLVGLGSGISMGYLGASHYGAEDISLLRAIPNITIVSPADCGELYKAVFAAAEYDGPVYIRLTGEPGMPVVYGSDFEYMIGKPIVLKEGGDILIIATGSMVSSALSVADEMETKGIGSAVIDQHTIKPFDANALKEHSEGKKLIVSMEEHSLIGGLGSAVAEYMADNNVNIPLLRIGMDDVYVKAGSYPYVKKEYHMDNESIISRIEKKLESLQ